MDCYTWTGGTISRGLVLTDHTTFGRVVTLGERGRGRTETVIPVDPHAPATIEEDRVVRARPSYALAGLITLAQDYEPSRSVLLRVSTSWSVHTRGNNGKVSTIRGQPNVIARGVGVRGDDDVLGTWEDVLVLMKMGDILRVNLDGSHTADTWAIWLGANESPETAIFPDRTRMRRAIIEDIEDLSRWVERYCGVWVSVAAAEDGSSKTALLSDIVDLLAQNSPKWGEDWTEYLRDSVPGVCAEVLGGHAEDYRF